MNIIIWQMAVEKNSGAAHNQISGPKWKHFYRACRDKKVVVVGCGKALEFYLQEGRNERKKAAIDCFCDNSGDKIGKKLSQIISLPSSRNQYAEETVKQLDEVLKEKAKEAVFLILPVKYYGALYEQVQKAGADSVFCYYMMEKGRFINKVKLSFYRIQQCWEHCIGQRCEKVLEAYTGWNRRQRRIRKKFIQMRKYPVATHKIFFMSSCGEGYWDHGKYIAEEIARQKLGWDLVWAVRDTSMNVPEGIRLIDVGDEDQLAYEMSTAKIWISNTELPLYTKKRKGQIFIETKHWTGVTLKKFFFDSKYISRNKVRRYLWRHNSKMMDYVITASQFDSESCRRGFRPRGKCVELGSARTDILFHSQEAREQVICEYHLNRDVHIAVYAPTYRFSWQKTSYNRVKPDYQLDYKRLLEELEEKFGGEWYLFLKLHPTIREQGIDTGALERVIDASLIDDPQRLLASCELLISDYSSLMFEPAYVKKPVFLFATDLKEYLQSEFDMLLDIRSLPFPLAQDNNQLIDLIRQFDYEKYKSCLETFLAPFEVKEDGHASERIVEFMKELLAGI